MRRIFWGIFLVSGAALILEVTLTKIISVIMWYHFSYLIISIALLGYGAAGARLAASKRLREEAVETLLVRYSTRFCLSALLGPLLVSFIGFRPESLAANPLYFLVFGLFYILIFLPFFFAGTVIALALRQCRAEVSRLYFFDLAGAGLGCLAAVYAISGLRAEGALALVAVLAAAGAWVMVPRLAWRQVVVRGLWLAVALVALVYLAWFAPSLINSKGKPINLLAKLDYTGWSALARVDVSAEYQSTPWFGVLVSDAYMTTKYPMRSLLQDGAWPTPLYKFSGSFQDLPFFFHTAANPAYFDKAGGDVLIIGPGGGPDVMVALTGRPHRITAVELNPLICQVVTHEFSDYLGGLFLRPDVNLVNAEGRNYLSRSRDRYDVIQLSGVDTFAALASGAYSVSEAYLYTIEALGAMIDHLKPNGVLAYSRFLFHPDRESLRLMAIAIEAMARRGITDPGRHLFVIGRGHQATILLKRDGFSEPEADRVQSYCDREKFPVLHHPYRVIDSEFSAYARADAAGRAAFRRDYLYNITPVSDNSPFFFQYYKWSGLWSRAKAKTTNPLELPLGHLFLLGSLAQVVLLSVVFIVWPLYRLPRDESRPGRGVWGIMAYFAALGAAYMTVEIVLMQKLMVFLGYPLRSLTVVLFTLLLSSGLGSYISQRWSADPLGALRRVVALIIVLIPLELMLFELVFSRFLGWPPALRFLLVGAAIFPLGLLMGMPFPLGIRLISSAPSLVPWCWGVNACFSVASSLLTVIISMTFGFRVAMLIAALVYLLGYLCLSASSARKLNPVPRESPAAAADPG